MGFGHPCELGLLVSIYLQCVVDRYAQDLVVFEADVARGEGSRVDDFAVSDRVAHDAEVVFELGYGGVGNAVLGVDGYEADHWRYVVVGVEKVTFYLYESFLARTSQADVECSVYSSCNG